MSDPSISELRAELAGLAASARAWLTWHEAAGSTGLPSGPKASQSAAPRQQAPAAASAQRTPMPRQPAPAPAPLVLTSPGPPPPISPSAGPSAATADAPLPLSERRTRLGVIAETVQSCTRCQLHATRTNTVFSRGDPTAELCFVGEGPGAEEDAKGAPFVGRAGQLLDKMIAAMGYQRDDVYICNVVKCRPPDNRKPELSEMASCAPYLIDQLKIVSPRVIVALGATAVQGLIGTSEGITRMRGKWKLYKGTIPIMPTFHPAYLLRQPAAKRDVWNDLQEVMRHLGKPIPSQKG